MAVLLSRAIKDEKAERCDRLIALLRDPYNNDESWSLTITRIQNGYILKGRNELGAPTIQVIEEDDKDELKAHESLLWQVIEYFGFYGTKHDIERLRIVREKRKD